MTSIRIPKAFHNFAAFYALDALEFDEMSTDDMGELIDNALQYLPKPAERTELHDFLVQMLKHGDDTLSGVWRASAPMLVYNKEAYRSLFTHTRDKLASGLKQI